MTTDNRGRVYEERDWLAFRYVVGEMSGEEAVAYERDLAGDEAACVAVAEAVELVGAIELVSPGLLVLREHQRRDRFAPSWRLVAGSLLTAAAMVAFLVFLPAWKEWRAGFGREGGQGREVAGLLPVDTVLAWTSLRLDADDLNRSEAAGDLTFEEGEATERAEAESQVPSWMVELAALELEPEPLPDERQEN